MLADLCAFSGEGVERVAERVLAALAGGRMQVLLVDGRWGSHSSAQEIGEALERWPAAERAALVSALGEFGGFLLALAQRAPLVEGWDAPFGGRWNFPNGGQAPLVDLLPNGIRAPRGGNVVPYVAAALLYVQP